LNFPHLHFKIG